MGNIYANSGLEASNNAEMTNNRKLLVTRTLNFKLIKRILFNEEIAPGLIQIKYDEAEERLNDASMIYYLFEVDKKIAGFCAFMKLDDMLQVAGNYAVDIGIFKKFRGKIAYDLGEIALKKFNEEFNPAKIFALIKEHNKASLYYAQRMGFKLIFKENGYFCLGT